MVERTVWNSESQRELFREQAQKESPRSYREDNLFFSRQSLLGTLREAVTLRIEGVLLFYFLQPSAELN